MFYDWYGWIMFNVVNHKQYFIIGMVLRIINYYVIILYYYVIISYILTCALIS